MKDSRHTGGHFEIACPDGFGCIEEGQWLRRRRKASPEIERLRKAEREAEAEAGE